MSFGGVAGQGPNVSNLRAMFEQKPAEAAQAGPAQRKGPSLAKKFEPSPAGAAKAGEAVSPAPGPMARAQARATGAATGNLKPPITSGQAHDVRMGPSVAAKPPGAAQGAPAQPALAKASTSPLAQGEKPVGEATVAAKEQEAPPPPPRGSELLLEGIREGNMGKVKEALENPADIETLELKEILDALPDGKKEFAEELSKALQARPRPAVPDRSTKPQFEAPATSARIPVAERLPNRPPPPPPAGAAASPRAPVAKQLPKAAPPPPPEPKGKEEAVASPREPAVSAAKPKAVEEQPSAVAPKTVRTDSSSGSPEMAGLVPVLVPGEDSRGSHAVERPQSIAGEERKAELKQKIQGLTKEIADLEKSLGQAQLGPHGGEVGERKSASLGSKIKQLRAAEEELVAIAKQESTKVSKISPEQLSQVANKFKLCRNDSEKAQFVHSLHPDVRNQLAQHLISQIESLSQAKVRSPVFQRKQQEVLQEQATEQKKNLSDLLHALNKFSDEGSLFQKALPDLLAAGSDKNKQKSFLANLDSAAKGGLGTQLDVCIKEAEKGNSPQLQVLQSFKANLPELRKELAVADMLQKLQNGDVQLQSDLCFATRPLISPKALFTEIQKLMNNSEVSEEAKSNLRAFINNWVPANIGSPDFNSVQNILEQLKVTIPEPRETPPPPAPGSVSVLVKEGRDVNIFANDLLQCARYFFSQLDANSLSVTKWKEANSPQFRALADFSNQLGNYIIGELLTANNPEEFGQMMLFYSTLAKKCMEQGNSFVAQTIYQTLEGKALRVMQEGVKLDDQHIKNMRELEPLLSLGEKAQKSEQAALQKTPNALPTVNALQKKSIEQGEKLDSAPLDADRHNEVFFYGGLRDGLRRVAEGFIQSIKPPQEQPMSTDLYQQVRGTQILPEGEMDIRARGFAAALSFSALSQSQKQKVEALERGQNDIASINTEEDVAVLACFVKRARYQQVYAANQEQPHIDRLNKLKIKAYELAANKLTGEVTSKDTVDLAMARYRRRGPEEEKLGKTAEKLLQSDRSATYAGSEDIPELIGFLKNLNLDDAEINEFIRELEALSPVRELSFHHINNVKSAEARLKSLASK